MKNSGRLASIIGVVCGAELIVAAVIGGAGFSVFFGMEGALVAGAVVVLGLAFVLQRRRKRAHSETVASE